MHHFLYSVINMKTERCGGCWPYSFTGRHINVFSVFLAFHWGTDAYRNILFLAKIDGYLAPKMCKYELRSSNGPVWVNEGRNIEIKNATASPIHVSTKVLFISYFLLVICIWW